MTPSSRPDRRGFLRLALAASAAASLPTFHILAQTKGFRGPGKPVRIGYLPITDATPLLVAHANRFYEAEGLVSQTPILFRSWAQIAEAFVAGQVNVVHVLSPIAIWLRYGKRFPAKVVAWNHTNGSALTVAPEIRSIQDLAGKIVAIPFWYSIHNVVLQKLLADAGLKLDTATEGRTAPDAVRLVVLSPSDMIAALANKSIAGYIVAEPFNAVAEGLGIGRILRFTGDVWRDHACCVVLMREEDVVQDWEWSQRVVNAVVRAQQWIEPHREETARLLCRDNANLYTPHPLAALERVFADHDIDRYVQSGAIRHPSWHEPRIGFQPYPFGSYTEELVRALRQTHVEGDKAFLDTLDPAFAARDLVDDSLVKTSMSLLGGAAAFGIDPSFTRREEIGV